MARTPVKTPPARRGHSQVVPLALLGLCLSVLALRVTYTEAPTVQTLSLPGGLLDIVYSLAVSGLLIFALLFWLLRCIWSGRPVYRVTGLEVGLGLFVLAAVIATFAASDKRLAINHTVTLLAPILMAILLVQILDSPARIRVTLLVVAALGVVSAYQCAEQALVSNQITVEQYEKDPSALLTPLGIAPGTFQQFLFEHRLYSRGIRGFFTTSNSAASFSLLASFAALALLLQQTSVRANDKSRSISRLYPLAAGAIVLIGLLMTQSKGGILGSLGAAVLFAVFSGLRNWLPKHRKTAWSAGIAITLIMSLAVGYAAISYGLKHGRLPGGNSMLVRWQYWRASAQMAADHALTGVGPGNFAQNYTHYKPASAPESVSDPHCFPLSLLTQYGPLGLLAFLAMMVVPVYRRTMRSPQGLSDSAAAPGERRLAIIMLSITCGAMLLIRPLLMPATGGGDMAVALYEIISLYVAPTAAFLIGFLLLMASLNREESAANVSCVALVGAALGCAMTGVLVHNLIDFAIFEPGVWTTLWTVMACFIATGQSHATPSDPVHVTKSYKPIAVVIAALLFAAYVHFVWQPAYATTIQTQQGREAAAMGRFDRAHALLDAASAADSLSPAAPYVNGRLYLQEAEHTASGRMPLLEKAMMCFRVTIQRDPADYKNYEKAGDAASLSGRYEEAYDWYAQAADRYPGSGRLQLRLARTAEQLGRRETALEYYRRAVEIEDAFREQFKMMYPERDQLISRLGQDNYNLAEQRIEELSK